MHFTQDPARRFEQLVAELLRELGEFDVKTNISYSGHLGHDFEIDILFGDLRNLGVVEVKHYRYSSPPSITLFDRALKQARYIKSGAMASRGLLAI